MADEGPVQHRPDRIKLVDASQPLAKVVADVKQVINARYPELFN